MPLSPNSSTTIHVLTRISTIQIPRAMAWRYLRVRLHFLLPLSCNPILRSRIRNQCHSHSQDLKRAWTSTPTSCVIVKRWVGNFVPCQLETTTAPAKLALCRHTSSCRFFGKPGRNNVVCQPLSACGHREKLTRGYYDNLGRFFWCWPSSFSKSTTLICNFLVLGHAEVLRCGFSPLLVFLLCFALFRFVFWGSVHCCQDIIMVLHSPLNATNILRAQRR